MRTMIIFLSGKQTLKSKPQALRIQASGRRDQATGLGEFLDLS